MAPPRGPPGYNGTQGPVGSPGPSGPRGSPGPGANFSLCQYQIKKERASNAGDSTYANAVISATEKKVGEALPEMINKDQNLEFRKSRTTLLILDLAISNGKLLEKEKV